MAKCFMWLLKKLFALQYSVFWFHYYCYYFIVVYFHIIKMEWKVKKTWHFRHFTSFSFFFFWDVKSAEVARDIRAARSNASKYRPAPLVFELLKLEFWPQGRIAYAPVDKLKSMNHLLHVNSRKTTVHVKQTISGADLTSFLRTLISLFRFVTNIFLFYRTQICFIYLIFSYKKIE